MNVMLCGPMTGDWEKDWPLFQEYEDKLRLAGVNVCNPLRVAKERWAAMDNADKMPEMTIGDEAWKWFGEVSFALDTLVFCDAVFLMPGWDESVNSLIIILTAEALSLKLLYFAGDKLCERKIDLIVELDSSEEEPDSGGTECGILLVPAEDYDQAVQCLLGHGHNVIEVEEEEDDGSDDDDDGDSNDGDDDGGNIKLKDGGGSAPESDENNGEPTTAEELNQQAERLLGQAKKDKLGDWFKRHFKGEDPFAKGGGRDVGKD